LDVSPNTLEACLKARRSLVVEGLGWRVFVALWVSIDFLVSPDVTGGFSLDAFGDDVCRPVK
jgi:hypothetical protein